jgi:ankyrin repeat protein
MKTLIPRIVFLALAFTAAALAPNYIERECADSFATFSPDSRLNSIIHAIASNDVERVEQMLTSRSTDLNRYDAMGLTALSRALAMDRQRAADMVHVLIAHGANANLPDCAGLTPLITAVMRDEPQLVHLLLLGGADPNMRSGLNMPALHLVAPSQSGIEIARMLLAAGADPNARDAEGNTASESEQRQPCAELVGLLKRAERAHATPAEVAGARAAIR